MWYKNLSLEIYFLLKVLLENDFIQKNVNFFFVKFFREDVLEKCPPTHKLILLKILITKKEENMCMTGFFIYQSVQYNCPFCTINDLFIPFFSFVVGIVAWGSKLPNSFLQIGGSCWVNEAFPHPCVR